MTGLGKNSVSGPQTQMTNQTSTNAEERKKGGISKGNQIAEKKIRKIGSNILSEAPTKVLGCDSVGKTGTHKESKR